MNRRSFNRLAASAGFAGSLGLVAKGSLCGATTATTEIKAVLELFTSQGCSSCPAADALFERFATRTDLVALTLPVDYWDYLGWKDTLASYKFTKRQREYARLRGDGQIYTPQLVVNGMAHTNGADATAIDTLVAKVTSARSGWTGVKITSDNGQLHISAGGAPSRVDGGNLDVTVWTAAVSKRVDVIVKRGENAGKTLSYFNVVRDVTAIGMWNGEPTTLRLPREALAQKGGEDACAVLLQAGMAGPIYGAAMLRTM